MKKALATIMGLAFAVSAMAGQYLIYDYNVSFKRIDAQFTKVTYEYGKYDGKKKDLTGYFDSFKTASDKLTGIVAVPACKDCNGIWEEQFGSAEYTVTEGDSASAFTVAESNKDAFVIVTRNGDNLSKNPNLDIDVTGKIVWILQAHVDSAMFGKGAAVRLAYDEEGVEGCSDPVLEVKKDEAKKGQAYEGTVTSLKAAKEAWLVLTYDVPKLSIDGEEVKVYPPVKGLATDDDCSEPINYGFLGYLCLNGNVSNAGFGTVTTTSTKASTTVGFCGSKVTDAASCIAINSISGSTIGYFLYNGFCTEHPALFDICTKEAGLTKYAPMAGTFTFKLNASASKNYGVKDLDGVQEYVDLKFKTDRVNTLADTGIEFKAEGGDDSGDSGDQTPEP